MTATILDGRALAKTLREELRAEIHDFAAASGITPTLAVLQVAGDAASERYIRSISKACGATVVQFRTSQFGSITGASKALSTYAGWLRRTWT